MYLFDIYSFSIYFITTEDGGGGKGVSNVIGELDKYTGNANAWISGEEKEVLNISHSELWACECVT